MKHLVHSLALRSLTCIALFLLLVWSRVGVAQEKNPGSEFSDQFAVQFAERCAKGADGDTVLGHLELIEYQVGSMPLILAAPHGGTKAPPSFAARTEGTLVSDSNTDELARSVANCIAELSKARPHLIVCHLQRKFMDANRPLDAACASDSAAVQTWHEYLQALMAAKQSVTQRSGRGLFIELHGHGHAKQRLELGYLLRERDFELPVESFEELKSKASVREIAERGQLSLEELIRGQSSLGAKLEEQGIAAVPGPTMREPGKDQYFNGGWNTMTHGSRDSGTISSIQIECHRVGFRDSKVNIARAAKQLAAAIVEFHKLHYETPGANTGVAVEK